MDRIQVYYQPQYDLREGRLIGAEALLRWRDAELGNVEPGQFVPLAEQSGLITTMGEKALRRACATAAAWRARGTPLARLSVNVSPIQVERSDFADTVEQILADTTLPPSLLELEITEETLLHAPERAGEVLARLRHQGVQIALDDFGVKYATFGYLHQLPLDRVKIDRVFVRDLPDDARTVAIVRAVITLGQSLNLELLAEGVEEPRQRDVLRAEGCAEGQGFHFSPALDEETMGAMLADRTQAT